ncbi:MAG: hypothetical protein ACOYOQ_10110 [Microthrixaceae bacterium]
MRKRPDNPTDNSNDIPTTGPSGRRPVHPGNRCHLVDIRLVDRLPLPGVPSLDPERGSPGRRSGGAAVVGAADRPWRACSVRRPGRRS